MPEAFLKSFFLAGFEWAEFIRLGAVEKVRLQPHIETMNNRTHHSHQPVDARPHNDGDNVRLPACVLVPTHCTPMYILTFSERSIYRFGSAEEWLLALEREVGRTLKYAYQ
jgi:hypothetical protein